MIISNKINSKNNRIFISNILFLCFLFHQYGPSYHFSFGSFGLFLLLLSNRRSITYSSLTIAFTVAASLLIAFVVNVIKYDDANNTLKIFRFSVNVFALFLILNRRNYIYPPSINIIKYSIILLFIFIAYQIFFDTSFRVPSNWIALSGDSTEVFVVDEYRSFSVIRGSGPYTEPSVLGMIFSCLFAFCLKIKTKVGFALSILCMLIIFLSGSLLGFIGLISIASVSIYKKEINRMVVLQFLVGAVVLGIVLFYFSSNRFAIFERSYSEGSSLDESTLTRIFYPFILIFYNFINLDFFGFSGDIYSHFLYTGLYNSLGNFPGHNGFLGVIITFGLIGMMIVWLLFDKLVGWEEAVVVILIGSQSGNFFSYEKVFLMLYVVMTLRGFKMHLNNKKKNQSISLL